MKSRKCLRSPPKVTTGLRSRWAAMGAFRGSRKGNPRWLQCAANINLNSPPRTSRRLQPRRKETPEKLPEPAADTRPPEPIETASASPAEEAGKAALRQRLQEMERAEKINREAVDRQRQQPQQQQQPPAMPAAVEKWLI